MYTSSDGVPVSLSLSLSPEVGGKIPVSKFQLENCGSININSVQGAYGAGVRQGNFRVQKNASGRLAEFGHRG